jgi:pimeloyl-ACP methyl ester carboxylesterase
MNGKPTLFLLHFLAGSAREWEAVEARLSPTLHTVAIDLPGFGKAAGTAGYTVDAMADHVAGIVRAAAPGRWLLAGHSMGAKVAAALARRAEDGEGGLEGLAGLITVAGSPPAPEPMSETRRTAMLQWFNGDAETSRKEAEDYIDANTRSLPSEARALAVADVLRAGKDAWRAWLESGSREDRRAGTGLLSTPALILAGEKDGDLGLEAQRRLMAPHFAQARVEAMDGVMHLIPLEAPDRLADRIAGFAKATLDPFPAPPVDADYAAALASPHVTTRLRDELARRGAPDDPGYRPRHLSRQELAVLRAACDRVVPQEGEGRIDLAARIDRMLDAGDGWRHAGLPPDPQAFAGALRVLDGAAREIFGAPFGAVADAERDAILEGVEAGKPMLADQAGGALLSAGQMTLWFEDFRAMAARLFVSHPATLAQMRYTGAMNGGDGIENFLGFARIGVGERDAWEPAPLAEPTP